MALISTRSQKRFKGNLLLNNIIRYGVLAEIDIDRQNNGLIIWKPLIQVMNRGLITDYLSGQVKTQRYRKAAFELELEGLMHYPVILKGKKARIEFYRRLQFRII